MAHFLEAVSRLAADPLGGRINREQIGVRGLDALELVHQGVVFGVCDFRCVEDVVEMLVAAEFGAKFFSAFRGIWVGVLRIAHGVNYRRL